MGFSLGSILGGIANPTSLIGPGISLLGSLFGGHGANNAGQDAYNQAKGVMSLQQALGNQYGGLASSAGADFGQDNGGYRQAVNSEAQFLQADPFTDQRSTQALADQTSGAAAAYQKAGAQLTNSLAQRGITDGSEVAGGLGDIATAGAAQQAAAENALAQQKIQTANSNRNALVSLLGGEADQDYGRETQALGAENGIDGSLVNDYTGVGNREYTQAQQQQAQQNALLSSIGSGVSDALDDKPDLQAAQAAAYYKMAGLDKDGNPLPATPGVSVGSGPMVPMAAGASPIQLPGQTPGGSAPTPVTMASLGFGLDSLGSGSAGGFGTGVSPSDIPAPASVGGLSDATALAPPAATSAAPSSPYKGAALISHPDGQAYSLDGKTAVTGEQADSLGIPEKGTPNSAGYDGDGDRITSD